MESIKSCVVLSVVIDHARFYWVKQAHVYRFVCPFHLYLPLFTILHLRRCHSLLVLYTMDLFSRGTSPLYKIQPSISTLAQSSQYLLTVDRIQAQRLYRPKLSQPPRPARRPHHHLRLHTLLRPRPLRHHLVHHLPHHPHRPTLPPPHMVLHHLLRRPRLRNRGLHRAQPLCQSRLTTSSISSSTTSSSSRRPCSSQQASTLFCPS